MRLADKVTSGVRTLKDPSRHSGPGFLGSCDSAQVSAIHGAPAPVPSDQPGAGCGQCRDPAILQSSTDIRKVNAHNTGIKKSDGECNKEVRN